MKAVVSSATSIPVHQAMQLHISEQRFHIHHHENLIFQLKWKRVVFSFFCFMPEEINSQRKFLLI
jgi:hypothetical protein